VLEIERHIPSENFYVGLLFNEGYWFVKLLRKQQLTVYKPYAFEDGAQLPIKTLSGWTAPADALGRFYLEPQEEETLYQTFIGISPSPCQLYLQFPQRDDRMSLITTRAAPGNIGYWDGEYSPYLDPSPGTELWTVHDLYPYFNMYLPGIFDGSPYWSDREVVYAQFYITSFTYEVVKNKEKTKSFLRGEKRCTVRTMGDGHRPIKAPAWLIEDYKKYMVQPEEV